MTSGRPKHTERVVICCACGELWELFGWEIVFPTAMVSNVTGNLTTKLPFFCSLRDDQGSTGRPWHDYVQGIFGRSSLRTRVSAAARCVRRTAAPPLRRAAATGPCTSCPCDPPPAPSSNGLLDRKQARRLQQRTKSGCISFFRLAARQKKLRFSLFPAGVFSFSECSSVC